LYSHTFVAACFVVALTSSTSQLIAGEKTDESILLTNNNGPSLDEWSSGLKARGGFDWNISGNHKKAKAWEWQ
jgi:hypothetical protein